MADSRNFERLVSALSIEERLGLLEKLRSHSRLSGEELYVDEEKSFPAFDIEDEFLSLSWFSRLWYRILSFFKGKPVFKIYEDSRVAALGEKVNEKTPGLYDYQRGLLLPVFFEYMEKLKEAARFFYSALDISVNHDKGAFFAFLGSLEMPDVHQKLQSGTDKEAIIRKYRTIGESELRQTIQKEMEEALTLVTEDNRSIMYYHARSLNCLKELSSFLFDRVLMAFNNDASVKGYVCSAGVVRELLVTLNNILISLKNTPPLALLESLFIFILQEREDEQDFDINKEIRSLLGRAEESLAVIREFNKKVPLTWIIRCSTRIMSFSPKEISGGEDWFIVYREYWKRRIDFFLTSSKNERRKEDLFNTFGSFFKGKPLVMISNAQTDANSEGMPLRNVYALSFLYTFYSAVFLPDINNFLKIILVDGDFYKKENRIEFADSYSNLLKIEDEIKRLEREISPTGNYGIQYAQAKQAMISPTLKHRKIQIALQEANEEAEKILKQAKEASRNMANILWGILAGDSRGKYDTLANFSKIAARHNQFAGGLEESMKQFQAAAKILDEIDAMDSGR